MNKLKNDLIQLFNEANKDGLWNKKLFNEKLEEYIKNNAGVYFTKDIEKVLREIHPDLGIKFLY